MKLHFYSNDEMSYKEDTGIGPMWKTILQWKDVALSLGIDLHIGPSDRQEQIEKNIHHAIPHRQRTIIEANNNGKLVYFNGQDWPEIGAGLDKVDSGIFSLGIKLQYKEGSYDKVPFKVVPFTYIAPGHPSYNFLDYRSIRDDIIKHKSFKYSVMWCGNTGSIGLSNRKAINKYLNKHAKRSIHGRYKTEQYYQYICDSMIGASAKGFGEFCHRDLEFMAIGTPFFRKIFNNSTYNPLIPNVHYYSIGGDEVGIDRTVKHFVNLFEPNGELRDFTKEEYEQYCEIGENAKKWYDENGHPRSSLKLLAQILEENDIL